MLCALFMLFLSSESHATINGQQVLATPDLVRITFTNGWICSGVYLNPTTILTVAHCLTPVDEKESLQIKSIQSVDDKELAVKQVELIPHPKFSSQLWHAYDVGLIKTTKNENFAGDFQLDTEGNSFVANSRLYGCGRISTEKNYGRRFGENKYVRFGSILFFFGKTTDDKENLGKSASIAPNDSGAPVIDLRSGKIVGVAATTTLKQSAKYGLATMSTATAINSEENLKFIEQHLQ